MSRKHLLGRKAIFRKNQNSQVLQGQEPGSKGHRACVRRAYVRIKQWRPGRDSEGCGRRKQEDGLQHLCGWRCGLGFCLLW